MHYSAGETHRNSITSSHSTSLSTNDSTNHSPLTGACRTSHVILTATLVQGALAPVTAPITPTSRCTPAVRRRHSPSCSQLTALCSRSAVCLWCAPVPPSHGCACHPQEHPHLRNPWLTLHPCGTEEALSLLFSTQGSECGSGPLCCTRSPEPCSCRYLLSFLSLLETVVPSIRGVRALHTDLANSGTKARDHVYQ